MIKLTYIKLMPATIILSVVTHTFTCAMAKSNGFIVIQDFSCSYASTAFEDERNFRRKMDPPPHPEALSTLQTREIAHYVGGFLTAWNAFASMSDVREESCNVYPPGLFAALHKIDAYCTANRTKNMIDGLFELLQSKEANPIRRN